MRKTCSIVRALEGVAQQVEELRESQGHERILPDIEAMSPLLGEDELPAPVARERELLISLLLRVIKARDAKVSDAATE